MGGDCISPARHSAFSTPIEMMALHRRDAAAVRRQAGRLQALHRPSLGVSRRSARRCWRPASIPTSSSSTARRAAPARRRWNSWTISACRCARASIFVHNALIGINAARPHPASAPPARSSPPSTWRARWRSAPTGAMRRAASCSRWAASSRCPATPTAARPASPPRTRRAQRALVVPTRSSGSTTIHRATLHALAELIAAAGLEHPHDFRADPFLAPRSPPPRCSPSPSSIRRCGRAN